MVWMRISYGSYGCAYMHARMCGGQQVQALASQNLSPTSESNTLHSDSCTYRLKLLHPAQDRQ